MADRYVDDTNASPSAPYETWGTAATTLVTSEAAASAGEKIFVASGHTEGLGTGTTTFSFPGTVASPSMLLSATLGSDPNALLAGATIDTTGTNISSTINMSGNLYAWGVTIIAATGTGSGIINLGENAQNRQTWENCKFQIAGSNSNGRLNIGTLSTSAINSVDLVNCEIKFSAAAQGLAFSTCNALIRNLTVNASSTAQTGAFVKQFTASSRASKIVFEGCDFRNLGSSVQLCLAPSSANFSLGVLFRNCRLPDSWTGTLAGSAPVGVAPGVRIEMHNCAADVTGSDNATNYALWIEEYLGTIRDETTIVKTSGASNGTTALAWKMTSNADAEYPHQALASPEIVRWQESTGSAITVTVEVVHDSQGAGSGSKFQDDEIWLEVQYLGDSTIETPLGVFIDDVKANVLATATNQADSSVTWTTTGLTSPIKQALSVAFTPYVKGYIHARVMLAKASKTVYVDPMLTVS